MQTFKSRSESKLQIPSPSQARKKASLHLTTLVFVSVVSMATGIAISWLLGNSHVSELFAYLQPLQDNPPQWLSVPSVSNKYYLLAPTLVLFLFVQIITRIFPQPDKFSRRLVAGILCCLLLRYFLWRSLSSLNLSNPVDGIFSVLLLGMEILAISGGMLQLLLMFTAKNRHQEADKYSRAVINGSYQPSVDILIPTYNEPDFILKRTVMGCQALDYPRKEVYLLDDTKRPEIKQLAQELGCHYFTRPDNSHAKAGNLNHAIPKTQGDLIAVFDADFVPTQNFLERTVGFFQKSKIALVQTPQSFYNSDPISRNLGLEKVLTSEEEVFYRQMQPIKDGAGSVVCSGTSFVVRRAALQEVGGFVTESLSEDYFTGIQLAAKGYDLVYLNEKLSAGLAAENISAHLDQRLRWARGTLQAFFISSNPLTISGLNLWQRLGHLEGLLHWFNSIPRIFFLFLPILSVFFSIHPYSSTAREAVYFFAPYYLTQITVFSWLNMRSRSALLSDLYTLVQSFPIAITVIKVMLSPFAKGFKVTPKGLASDRYYYNWNLALPLILLLVATTISFSISLVNTDSLLNIGLLWNGYNIITLGTALLVLLDIPKPTTYQWFTTRKQVQIISEDKTYRGVANQLSEEGVEILIEKKVSLGKKVSFQIMADETTFSGDVTQACISDQGTIVKVKFNHLTLSQQRSLVYALYCRPGQWKTKKTPGELKSFAILLQILSRPLRWGTLKIK
ncbi:Cellulose synthase (UDP-forming) [Hyella patelloides LEGE 07179]|uniref:Cellulose synthase (UDP-forming) n=1 Tax=Hyella patelloides LEGE 07179 TaxID=945734 RepID=A0A563W4I9_9CYAN|nr:glycosyltransferase [Hyella patelloides]VEP18576.1 Cellulose synthase (UDP-forming) [Hyella patelloides LEGE 07179]